MTRKDKYNEIEIAIVYAVLFFKLVKISLWHLFKYSMVHS